MSVTFTFAKPGMIGLPCDAHLKSCDCEEHDAYRYCDHIYDSRRACGCEAFDVNVANVNARTIMERLGLAVEDLVGTIDADDFLGRAMVANVGRDDSGIADAIAGGPGATLIHCGVEAGYSDQRMDALIALAVEARSRGLMVGWA